MNKASNAVLALCRSFYGKRILTEEYESLLLSKTFSEFLSLLKSKEGYFEVFEKVLPNSKSLEGGIEKVLFNRFEKICRFEMAIGNEFYDYFITRIEIEEILKATLFLFGKGAEEYIGLISPFAERRVSFDLFALGKAKNFEELNAVLSHSEYAKLYKSCIETPNFTYLTFEEAFEKWFDDYLVKLCKKCYKGDEQNEIFEIIKISNDIRLIEKRLRISKYYTNFNLFETEKINVPKMTMLSEKQFKKLVCSKSVSDVSESVKSSVYKNCVDENERVFCDNLRRYLFSKCKKQIRFSSNPGTVTYCYMILAQFEKNNLTRIVEGIKYKMFPDDIKEKLILE